MMHALALCVLVHMFSDLTVAQPPRRRQHRHPRKRMVEEVLEIEVEVWTTVTLDGPAPTGWHHSDHPNETEMTVSSWMTTIPDSTTATFTHTSTVGCSKNLHKTPKDKTSASTVPQNIQSTSATSIAASPTNGVTASSSSRIVPKVPISPASAGTQTSAAVKPSGSSTAPAAGPAGSSSVASSPSSAPNSTGKYPFSALVAFGDNLSDNGNGSYAHHVADQNNPDNTIYGARTWTNAQVAVSFLTDLLGVPMHQDFAFGHAWGGSDAGATLDNTMSVSDFHNATVAAGLGCPGAPPASQQVSTYISQGVNKDALHFLWIGNNDADMVGFYQPAAFTQNLTTGMTKVVSQLLNAGAPYVFVPNIYPKQLAPIVPKYYGWTTPAQQDAFGTFISNANLAMKSALASMSNSDKVIYYDANAFLTSVWNNAASYGITNAKDTNGWPAFCDGDPDQTREVKVAIAAGSMDQKDPNNWAICVDDHKQDEWFWMQYLDMTSHVHELLAGDMSKAIAAHFA